MYNIMCKSINNITKKCLMIEKYNMSDKNQEIKISITLLLSLQLGGRRYM